MLRICAASPRITQKVYSYLPNEVVVCSIVKGELVYGALHGTRPEENLRILEQFFEVVESVPFDDAAAYQYGRIRSELAALGTPIGANDFLIAAIAKAHDLTLVTHNVGEFSRVPGLRIEDWAGS